MLLDDLLSRRLVVLTGKGGVGKSVVGAALAVAARERGKRVLLVEVAAPVEAARLLGGPPSQGRETEALPGLFTVNLDPAAVMDEYVRHVVKLEMLARRILGSPIYRRFFAAAPGLKELMVLGKIMVLEEARARLSHEPQLGPGRGGRAGHRPRARVPEGPARRLGGGARGPDRPQRPPRARACSATPAAPRWSWWRSRRRWRSWRRCSSTASPPRRSGWSRRRSSSTAATSAASPTRTRRRCCASRPRGRTGTLEPDVPLPAALRAARRQIRRRKLTRFYQARLRRTLDTPLVSLPFLFREALGLEDVRLLAGKLEAA